MHHDPLNIVILVICAISQVIFFAFELTQLFKIGLMEYITDLFTWFEMTQFFLFAFFFMVKMTTDFESNSIMEVSILIILVV